LSLDASDFIKNLLEQSQNQNHLLAFELNHKEIDPIVSGHMINIGLGHGLPEGKRVGLIVGSSQQRELDTRQ